MSVADPTHDVVLDTSAASRLVDDSVLECVIGRANAIGVARIVVPVLVVAELVDHEDKAAVRDRLGAIGDLRTGVGRDRFAMGEDVRVVVAADLASRASRVPAIAADQVNPLIAMAASGADVPGLARYLGKDHAHELDRRAREDCLAVVARRHQEMHPGSPPPSNDDLEREARRLFEETMAAFRTNVLREGAFGLELAVQRDQDRRRVRASPETYPACSLLAGAVQLQAMTSAFANVGYGGWAGIFRAPRRNDWVDARIVVCAAHARHLVTNDVGQAKRMNYLAETFGARVRALWLDAWLGRADTAAELGA